MLAQREKQEQFLRMAEIIQFGTPPIDVNLRLSARARRISLRVSGLDGKVSLTVPRCSSMREAQDFLREKESWIRKHLETRPEVELVMPGVRIPVEGDEREVIEYDGKRVLLHPDVLLVPAGADRTPARVRAFLKTMARDRLADASERYAEPKSLDYKRLTIRDTRSRWGSCTAEGNLMYSWRLIMAPPEVLDYVAAHEVAHLAHMDHSPRFWGLVEQMMPDFKVHRKWLRDNGASLHRFRFEA